MKNSLESPPPGSPTVLPLVGIALVSLAVGVLVVTRELGHGPAERGPSDRPEAAFATHPMEILANGTIALDWERVPGADSYVLEYLAGDLSLVATAWVGPDLTTEIPYVNPRARDPILFWRMVACRDDQPVAVSQLREYPSQAAVLAGRSDHGP